MIKQLTREDKTEAQRKCSGLLVNREIQLKPPGDATKNFYNDYKE